jgi:predicted O-methyltransferase YrrM
VRRVLRAIGKPARQAALLLHSARYDEAAARKEQDGFFAEWGLSRSDGLSAVEQALARYPQLSGSMQSEHYVLFGAISRAKKPKRILEIGTFDGRGAGMLAALFPNAHIDTMDLPDDDPMFKDSYKRTDDAVRTAFIKKRNALLALFGNVSFEQLNSVSLSFAQREKYDLIWVDGDHGYPTVVIDILNAVRLLNPGGLVLCDDVTKTEVNSLHGRNSMYSSTGAFQTLNALAGVGIARFGLIYKRLNATANSDPRRRKYIAISAHAATR